MAEAEKSARDVEQETRAVYNDSVTALNKAVSEIKSLAISRSNARAFMREQLDLLHRHVKRLDKVAESDGAMKRTLAELENGMD